MLNSHNLRMMHKYTEKPVNADLRPLLALIVSFIAFLILMATTAHSAPMKPIVVQALTTKASWYGGIEDKADPWVHTRTADGSVYNENALTAASWDFPFGSRIKVTNLANLKSVIVKINDRGPSKRLVRQGRTIDLSRAAFNKIANLDLGVINVYITKVL